LFNDYIVDLRGEACNTASNNNTLRPWYAYANSTDDLGNVQVIYLITQDNASSPSTAANTFISLFDTSSNNTLSSVAAAISTATNVTLLSATY
jgi:hypothetical protein